MPTVISGVTRVSTDATGVQGNGTSLVTVHYSLSAGGQSISSDGTKVLFQSTSTNLATGTDSGANHIYIKDLITGEITLVDASITGVPLVSGGSQAVMSADGTKIAFAGPLPSSAYPGSFNRDAIYLKDLTTGILSVVSLAPGGATPDNASDGPSISADGTRIAFQSRATNLGPIGTYGYQLDHVFVRDMTTGTLTAIDFNPGTVSLGNSASQAPVISGNGQVVVFQSSATNLIAGDTSGVGVVQLYAYDMTTGAITWVGRNSANALPSAGASSQLAISYDGTKVVFQSNNSGLVDGDTNERGDIFIKHLNTGLLTLISTDINGVQGDDNSSRPSISDDGNIVAFISDARNLVAGTTRTDPYSDIFVKNLITGEVALISRNPALGDPTQQPASPILSGDGTLVLFDSGASNLVASDTNGRQDVFIAPSIVFIEPTLSTGGGHSVPACYARGTRILTSRGEVAVEELRAGDLAATFTGRGAVLKPVTWIGSRRMVIDAHARPNDVRPIRILAHAFADGVPCRDLLVSPDHALFLHDAADPVGARLVPARYLLNGANVAQDTECRWVQYFHVELATHDVLLAENLPAESYLDTGNRGDFANAEFPALHAEFRQRSWSVDGCAPMVGGGRLVAATRAALAERALAAGFVVTTDPDLCVRAGNTVLTPIPGSAGRRFAVPDGTNDIRLISRAGIPGGIDPALEDRRALGVMLRSVHLLHDGRADRLAFTDRAFGTGWHQAEGPAGARWRWTYGDARLTLPAGKARVLELDIIDAHRSWTMPQSALAAFA